MLANLNEYQRRIYLATEALKCGYGGISKVSRESGISRVTITAGIKEINAGITITGRVRKTGGGRKKVTVHKPNLADAIELVASAKTDKG